VCNISISFYQYTKTSCTEITMCVVCVCVCVLWSRKIIFKLSLISLLEICDISVLRLELVFSLVWLTLSVRIYQLGTPAWGLD